MDPSRLPMGREVCIQVSGVQLTVFEIDTTCPTFSLCDFDGLCGQFGIPSPRLAYLPAHERFTHSFFAWNSDGARTIVLTEGNVRSLDEGALLALIGHELGHASRYHPLRASIANVAFDPIARSAWQIAACIVPWMMSAIVGLIAVATTSMHPATLVLLSSALYCVLTLVCNTAPYLLSHYEEFAADRLSASTVSIDGMIRVLHLLKSEDTTAPLYAAITHSHPSPASRLKRLRKLRHQETATAASH